MNILLDTHVLLWWVAGTRLTQEAHNAIEDPDNLVFVSAASVWEAGIKAALGKLAVDGDLIAATEADFEPLPISLRHADAAARLPPHHRDPFDRMLIAQARAHGLVIATRDSHFDLYDVPTLRA